MQLVHPCLRKAESSSSVSLHPYSVAGTQLGDNQTRAQSSVDTHMSARTHTYPSPQAPEAVHFGFGGHEVVEAVGEGLLGLLGRLGVVGNSRG